MIEVNGSTLVFTFPDIHPEAKLSIEFIRTLRIPDDDNTYPLPPGLGSFPMKHVDDFKENLSDDMLKRGGVMLPMYQSEALWVRFSASNIPNQGRYPFAVKIAAGRRSAITGKDWVDAGLRDKDYIVSPTQPWIDGFVVSEGTIRQFVAAPLGMGFTVEEQLTQKAEFGGMQVEVFPMKREEFDKRFPVRVSRSFGRRSTVLSDSFSEDSYVDSMAFACMAPEGAPSAAGGGAPEGALRSVKTRGLIKTQSMGMAAGGKMKQEIFPDPYGLEVWDLNAKSRSFVHLLNSMTWKQVTGQNPPTVPQTAKEYARYGLPWFEAYSDGPALGATEETGKIKSVNQLAEEKGFTILPENESVLVSPGKIVGVKIPKNAVKDGKW